MCHHKRLYKLRKDLINRQTIEILCEARFIVLGLTASRYLYRSDYLRSY